MAANKQFHGLLVSICLVFLIFFLGDKGVSALRQTVPAAQNLTTMNGTLQDKTVDASGITSSGLFLKTAFKTQPLCVPQTIGLELVSDGQLRDLMGKPVTVWADLSAAKPVADTGEAAPPPSCAMIFDLRSGPLVLFDYDAAKNFVLIAEKISGIIILLICLGLFALVVIVVRKSFSLPTST